MTRSPRGALIACLLALSLASCWSDEDKVSDSQKYYFLESLKQVEEGGRRLRTPDLDRQAMNEALGMLDQGLRLAFEVDREFLDGLDLRLGKNFERYFVKGVENYRLGIEAGDEQQQREGLRLLARWSEFWQAEQAAIRKRLEPG
ncbi:MAG: hypothetical protein PVI79_00215 [Gammaproteobacteria bacterium]|jgi:hypothetical protein